MYGSGASCLREMQWHRLKVGMHYHLGTDLGLARSLVHAAQTGARSRSSRAAGGRRRAMGCWLRASSSSRSQATVSGPPVPGWPSGAVQHGRKGGMAGRRDEGPREGDEGPREGDEGPREGDEGPCEGGEGPCEREEWPQGYALVAGQHSRQRPAPPRQNVRPLVPAAIVITSSSLRVIE
jgi:hypothetical protein